MAKWSSASRGELELSLQACGFMSHSQEATLDSESEELSWSRTIKGVKARDVSVTCVQETAATIQIETPTPALAQGQVWIWGKKSNYCKGLGQSKIAKSQSMLEGTRHRDAYDGHCLMHTGSALLMVLVKSNRILRLPCSLPTAPFSGN